MDVPNGSLLTSEGDNRCTPSVDNGRSLQIEMCNEMLYTTHEPLASATHREEDVRHVLLDCLVVQDRINSLANADTFSGQNGLVDAKTCGSDGEQSAVCRNLVADGD